MTFRTPTIGNMTFRPAARCGLDVGGNLRHRIGSAWSGGIYLSIVGRFGRGFRDWVAGEWIPGSLMESLPGGGGKERCFGGFALPTARRRAATTGPAWSGCPAYRAIGERCHRHVIVITPSRHGPCDLPSSSGALSGRGLDFSFLNSAFVAHGSGLLRGRECVAQYDGRFSEEVFLVPQLWDTAQNPRRGPGRPTERCGQVAMRGECLTSRQVVSCE